MDNSYFIVDLRPTIGSLTNEYLASSIRLIGSFNTYLDLIMNMYKAIHNNSGDDEILIDHYLNGSYHVVSEAGEVSARKAICAGLDSVLMLTNVHGVTFPGKIRNIFIEYNACIMVIEYGGENDAG